MRLDGKRILITGSSSGIGRATALAVAALGGRCLLNGRDEARLQSVLTSLPGDSHAVAPYDLAADLDGIPTWILGLAKDAPFSGLVHCAGIELLQPIRMHDPAAFDQVMATNTGAALMLVRGLRQASCHAKPCSVVLMSSVAALVGQPGHAIYCASKGAVNAMVRALAVELARDAIRVNAVCPGLVESAMGTALRDRLPPAAYAGIAASYPLGLGRPEDAADAVAFLLSERSRWITGSELVVDGGHSAQ